MNVEMERWIDFYVDQGYSIIPIRDHDKKPNIPKWNKYQTERPTPDEIQSWKDADLFKNIGVICGKVSDNLVVIDIDDQSILSKLNMSIEQILAEGHWMSRTGRGYHIWLRNKDDPGKLTKEDDLHIEYRANGGYIVAPNSIHPEGGQYKFLYNKKPEDMKPLKTSNTRLLYDNMVDKLGKTDKNNTKKHLTNKEIKKHGVPHGMRDNSAYRIAAEYKDKGCTKEDTLLIVGNWNNKLDEPMPQSDINRIVNSAYTKPVKEMESEKKNDGLAEYDVLYTAQSGVTTVRCQNLADYIFDKLYHFETIIEAATNKEYLYYYDEEKGYFVPGGDILVKKTVDDLLHDRSLSSLNRKREVVDFIKHKRHVKMDDFLPAPNYINVRNGVLDIVKKELFVHSPKYRFLGQLPIYYNEDADCPNIKRFCKNTFWKVDIPLIQEMFGFCLYRKYRPHKVFMFLGSGRNGKSTTMAILQYFLGKGNYSAETLSSIVDNRFSLANLFGKLANISGEMGGTALSNTDPFKLITGEDEVSAERKGQDAFTFKNHAKLIFLANQVPLVKKDKTTAFFNRWMFIMMPNTFDENNPKTNPDILDDILNDQEMSGLLNWALDGLARVKKNRHFSYDKDKNDESAGDRYYFAAFPVMRFCTEHLQLFEDDTLPVEDVYRKYFDWATSKQIQIDNRQGFNKQIQGYMYDKATNKGIKIIRVGRDQQKFFKNMRWRDEPTDVFDRRQKNLDTPKPHDKVALLKKKGYEASDAGYSITDEWLKSYFNNTDIRKFIEGGYLSVKPDGSYDIL